MLTALLTLFVLAVVGLVVVGVLLAMVGVVLGLAFAALKVVVPVLLVGFVVTRLLQRGGRHSHRRLSPADQRWLDS